MQRKPATDKHTESNVCLILHTRLCNSAYQITIKNWVMGKQVWWLTKRSQENAFERLANNFISAISRFKWVNFAREYDVTVTKSNTKNCTSFKFGPNRKNNNLP